MILLFHIDPVYGALYFMALNPTLNKHIQIQDAI